LSIRRGIGLFFILLGPGFILGLFPPRAPLAAQPPPIEGASPETLPTAQQMEAAGAHIGTIAIHAGDVFDLAQPGENKALFRWANRLHRDTRARVVRRQLVFAEGDLFSASALAESERALRAQRFLYDAKVRAVAYHDGVVDIDVWTRDNWSLKPGLSFSRSGGANRFHFELQDSNFLGLGKNLAIEHQTDVDRSSNLLSYSDPNLFGSRYRAELVYADNSDGTERRFALERPFFSLATRYAGGITLTDDRLVTSRYTLGHVRDRFEEANRLAEVWLGLSRGLVRGATQRLRLGFTYDERAFAAVAGEPPTALPPDRLLIYPWLGWNWIQDRFVVEHDLDRIDRPEDLSVGWQGSAKLGFAAATFGSDRDAVVYDGSIARGFKPSARQILLAVAALDGRLESGNQGPAILSLGLRYLFRDFTQQALYASATVDLAHALDPERQLLLGGDNGLRGYPLRYEAGDRRVLFALEQRWYGEREYFHLFRLGAALFGDLGRAWFGGESAPGKVGWLRDVGAGLRFAPSRTSHANVIRLDVAFPLDGNPSIDRIQYLVSTSERF